MIGKRIRCAYLTKPRLPLPAIAVDIFYAVPEAVACMSSQPDCLHVRLYVYMCSMCS